MASWKQGVFVTDSATAIDLTSSEPAQAVDLASELPQLP